MEKEEKASRTLLAGPVRCGRSLCGGCLLLLRRFLRILLQFTHVSDHFKLRVIVQLLPAKQQSQFPCQTVHVSMCINPESAQLIGAVELSCFAAEITFRGSHDVPMTKLGTSAQFYAWLLTLQRCSRSGCKLGRSHRTSASCRCLCQTCSKSFPGSLQDKYIRLVSVKAECPNHPSHSHARQGRVSQLGGVVVGGGVLHDNNNNNNSNNTYKTPLGRFDLQLRSA